MSHPHYNVSSKYGAPMGRNTTGEDLTGKCRLERVRLDSGGYDKGGAYWGTPSNLWYASDDAGNEHYLRAYDRAEAKLKLMKKYPGIRFYR
jgi:hypothetical protein